MRILIAIAALTLLGGCETARQDRVFSGAAIGGLAGGVIGGVATNSVGGALAGGVIGAAAGGIIADETRPRGRGRCYARTDSGQMRRVRCS